MISSGLKIQKLIIEITNTDQENYKKDEIEVSNLIKSALLKATESLFYKKDSSKISVKIPQIEVDLGTLVNPFNEELLVAQFISKITPFIEKELTNYDTSKNNLEGSQNKSQEKEIDRNEIDVLLYFLEFGYLPWYANKLPPGSILNDNNLIVRVNNFFSTKGGETSIIRFLNHYEYKDIIRFSSALVAPNFKNELDRFNNFIFNLLKSQSSISIKIAKELKQQTLIDLIKNSGQIKPIKELIKSYFEKSDEFKNIADITMLSNIQNASTDDISKIIEKALESYEKRNLNVEESKSSKISESEIKQIILYYLLNASVQNNLTSINEIDFFKYLKEFIIKYPDEIFSIYKQGKDKQNLLLEILIGLSDEHLKSIFNYYVKIRNENDVETNEFITLINRDSLFTQQNKALTSIFILDNIAKKNNNLNKVLEESIKFLKNKADVKSNNLSYNAEYDYNVTNKEIVENELNLSEYYFNDLLKFFFENETWPWWSYNYARVYGSFNLNDNNLSLLSLINNYQLLYPNQFNDFIINLFKKTDQSPKFLLNLTWPIVKIITDKSLHGIKNTFTKTVEGILKLFKNEMGLTISTELSTQQFVYKILRDKNLYSLGFNELINLLILEVAKNLTLPLWKAYSIIFKKHQELELPIPISKDEIESILIYNKEREDQFVNLMESIKFNIEVNDDSYNYIEFISDKHEEIILRYLDGENINLNIFPSPFAFKQFILERLLNSDLFSSRLSGIILSQKNKALIRIFELERIINQDLIFLILKKEENIDILNNFKLLLSELYPENLKILTDNLRVVLINENVWKGNTLSFDLFKRLLNRFSINLSIQKDILEVAVLNQLSKIDQGNEAIKSILNIDNYQQSFTIVNDSIKDFNKIRYESELLFELFNFFKEINDEKGMKELSVVINKLSNKNNLKEWLNNISNRALRDKVLLYVDGVNKIDFNYLIDNIKRTFYPGGNNTSEKENLKDSNLKVLVLDFLEVAVLNQLSKIDQGNEAIKSILNIDNYQPSSTNVNESIKYFNKIRYERELLFELFNFFKGINDERGMQELSVVINKLSNKNNLKEWLNNISNEALKDKVLLYVDGVSKINFNYLIENIKKTFYLVGNNTNEKENLNTSDLNLLLVDFIKLQKDSTDFSKLQAILNNDSLHWIEEFAKKISGLDDIELAKILKDIVERKISSFDLKRLVISEKVTKFISNLEFWQNKLEFRSSLIDNKIKALTETNIESDSTFKSQNINEDPKLINQSNLSQANNHITDSELPKSKVFEEKKIEHEKPLLSFIKEQNNVVALTKEPIEDEFREISILNKSDINTKQDTFYNPEAIADILTFFLKNFELPWWSPIKDIKELEKITRELSVSENKLFRQRISKYALHYSELFGKIIKELDNAPSIDFNSIESKIKLENELRGHLDFLTNFINNIDDKDKLMQYINLIVSDFQIDEDSKIRDQFLKIVLTSIIIINPKIIEQLDNYDFGMDSEYFIEFSNKSKELNLLYEIKNKETEQVRIFLNNLEAIITVDDLNSEISISDNVLAMYNKSDKISGKQLLNAWLKSIELFKHVPRIKIIKIILELEKKRQIDKSQYIAQELLQIVSEDILAENIIVLPYVSFINVISLVLSKFKTVTADAKKNSLQLLTRLLSTDQLAINLPLHFKLFLISLKNAGIENDELKSILDEIINEISDSNLNYISKNIMDLLNGKTQLDNYVLISNQKTELNYNTSSDSENLVSILLAKLGSKEPILEMLIKNESSPNVNSDNENNNIKLKKPLEINLDERIYIPNAGLVLLWPFLSRLFANLNYTEKGKFLTPEKRIRAIYLSQYLVGFTEDNPEYTLMLNKLLCGMELNEPIEEEIKLTEEEKAETRSLLSSVIAQWKEMNNTSVENFQRTFLQREGVMFKTEENWNVIVGKSSFDVLLLRLPWGISIIKYSWNNYLIFVEWKAMT